MSGIGGWKNVALRLAAAFLLASMPAGSGFVHAAEGLPRKVAVVEGITEYRLDNGLRILLYPRAAQSVLTVSITYFAGARSENPYETGIAHLLEHITFRGTRTYPDIRKRLDSHGATVGSSVSTDRTTYYEVLPATVENLAFGLNLEADRMQSCKFDSADLLEEKAGIREELESLENDPTAALAGRLSAAAYAHHPFGRPVFGTLADLDRISIERVREFYRMHYRPDNALLVVTGNFDSRAALLLIQKLFGPIVPRPEAGIGGTQVAVSGGDRAVTVYQPGGPAVIGLLYRGPAASQEDFAAVEAVVNLLLAEPSGPMYRALVAAGMVNRIGGGVTARADSSSIQIFASVREGVAVDAARDRMIRAIEEFASGRIRRAELEKFRNAAVGDIDNSLNDSERSAIELSGWAVIGDWRWALGHRDRWRRVTESQVRSAAAATFIPAHRTVGLMIPNPADEPGAAEQPELAEQPADTPEESPLPDTPDAQAMTEGVSDEDSAVDLSEMPETPVLDSPAGRGESVSQDSVAAQAEAMEWQSSWTELRNGMKVAVLPADPRLPDDIQ